MADVQGALPLKARQELRDALSTTEDHFISALPKVELHVHIEGCLTPDLKWKFANRNGQTLSHPHTGELFTTLEQYRDSHDPMKAHGGTSMNNSEETLSFFDAYYGGFEVLKTRQDYYDLAMHYFEHAAAMNVRYVELFFDPQGHTATGTTWETMMNGLREAQKDAEERLQVKSAWIMCFLRDLSPGSAMEHYMAALEYRNMIVGIGLDSNEDGRPPMLFKDVFERARRDGLRLTVHCDVGKTYPLQHIKETVNDRPRGIGADRVDHGLNVVESPDLMNLIRRKDVGMTICPWSYIRHQPFEEVFERIRTLYDAGIRLAIASDDPAFMEDTWIHENLLVLRKYCRFEDKDFVRLTKDTVEMCWASKEVKTRILDELGSI